MGMSLGSSKYKSEINITPYIDILLVLLIIFMTVTPLKQHEHPVRVPQPAPAAQQKEVRPDSVIVDMDLDRSIRLNDQPITLPELETKLTNVFRRRAVKNLFIRGDANLPYGDVFVLLDIAKRSGVGDIALLEKKKNIALADPSSPAK